MSNFSLFGIKYYEPIRTIINREATSSVKKEKGELRLRYAIELYKKENKERKHACLLSRGETIKNDVIHRSNSNLKGYVYQGRSQR